MVTDQEVKQIISSDLASEPFIQVATNLVNEEVKGLSADRLHEVTRWLAAHFLSIRDQSAGAVIEKEIDDTREIYLGDRAGSVKGLNSTRYGRQAILLDTTGTLARLSSPRVKFKAFGV